jgi:hypothetical protein
LGSPSVGTNTGENCIVGPNAGKIKGKVSGARDGVLKLKFIGYIVEIAGRVHDRRGRLNYDDATARQEVEESPL